MRDIRKEEEKRILFLAFFFLCGVVMGQVLAAGAPESVSEELRRYITERGQSALAGNIKIYTIFAAFSAYARYPAMAAILGMIPAGGLFLCVLIAAYGFTLSFSIGAFVNKWGEYGVMIGAAAVGFRCLITLICFFLFAPPFPDSEPFPRRLIFPGGIWRRRAFLCMILILTGVCAEIFLIPRLLRWIMINCHIA